MVPVAEAMWLIGSGTFSSGGKFEILWDRRAGSLAELFLLQTENLLGDEGAERLAQAVREGMEKGDDP